MSVGFFCDTLDQQSASCIPRYRIFFTLDFARVMDFDCTRNRTHAKTVRGDTASRLVYTDAHSADCHKEKHGREE